MTNKHTAKRPLFAAIISLVLCLAMFAGTTFAWFTDSITNTKNKILAGNLDIEMQYFDAEKDDWAKFDSNADIIPDTLWEPGHTEVIYLKISNPGTLALKYQLGVNIFEEVTSINVDDEHLKLSNYIYFDAIETSDENFYADRDAAQKAATEPTLISAGYSYPGTLEGAAQGKANDEEYVALVIYMPESVGNKANYKTGEVVPSITLGVELYATQLEAEKDSYGDDYDENAGVISATPENIQDAIYAAQPGDTIYLTDGNYGTLVLKNADGSAKKGITIKRDRPGNAPNLFSVDFIDLNGAQDVTISGICFDVTGAQKSRDTKFYTNITGGFENAVGAKNIVIENCRFKNADAYWEESTINPSNYVPILFQENNRPTSHASNLTIKDCYVDVSVYSFARLNYMGKGTVTITGTQFAARVKVLHNALTFTGNSSDLTIVGNTFGAYDTFDTSKVKSEGWNSEKAMLSSSWQGGDLRIEVRDNTFCNVALGAEGNVIDLKNSYKDHYTLIFEGNTFTGGLTGMTEATAPCIKP